MENIPTGSRGIPGVNAPDTVGPEDESDEQNRDVNVEGAEENEAGATEDVPLENRDTRDVETYQPSDRTQRESSTDEEREKGDLPA